MTMSTKPLIALILPILAITLTPGAAGAGSQVSYSGNWPVKADLPPHFGNTGCLTLVDDGTAGSPHSGPVSATGDLGGGLSGTFQIINHILVVNLQAGSDTGEVVFLQFIAHASDGDIGAGAFNEPGYLPNSSYALTFGNKGGC